MKFATTLIALCNFKTSFLSVFLFCFLLLCPAPAQEGATPTPSAVTTQETPQPNRGEEEPAASPTPSAEAATPDESPQKPKEIVTTERTDNFLELRGPISGYHLMTLSGSKNFSAEFRGKKVVDRLLQLLKEQKGEAQEVEIETLGQTMMLTVDGKGLVTITEGDLDVTDVDYLPDDQRKALQLDVAIRWKEALQRELDWADYMRKPAYLSIAIPLTGILFLVAWLVHRKLKAIRETRGGRRVWGLDLIVWAGALIGSLWLFLPTKPLAKLLYQNLIEPILGIWIVIIVGSLLSNLMEGAVNRYIDHLRSQSGVEERRDQRLYTLGTVACKTVRGIMILLMVAFSLSLTPIDFTPLVTGAGVLGVALGLAAQDFLRDTFAGISILLEDRFGVGDFLEWGSHSGTVEVVNLHNSQIRTMLGGLITVPNGDLRVVKNLSKEWGMVDYKVGIAYDSDLVKALEVLKEEADLLYQGSDGVIIDEPVLAGVNRLADSSVELRIFIKTKAAEQWAIERKFNQQIKLRFDRERIEIPFPQTTVWLQQPPSQDGE